MPKKAELFAPLVIDDEGNPDVTFPPGHPGHGDWEYRAHRNSVAALALGHRPGDPVPDVDYRPSDHACWQEISSALTSLHPEYAAAEAREAAALLDLPTDRVPQLRETSARLTELTGFSLRPAAGIVPLREFYGSLADLTFNATQFIRHHSRPLFSPEPDMVHEVLGHGTTMASGRFAKLYQQAGEASRRAATEEALQLVSKVFWFTLEYGVLKEDGEYRAYGASLLSAYGELQNFRKADIRPLDAREMTSRPYDVTSYQPVLFAAENLSHLEDFLGGFFSEVDGDTPGRLAHRAGAGTS
ncbi:phenylalanine 4-monooxygenase [Streptomyces piniterrae]|uniref:Phenylalanine 4-monooxygenase n=1 Tax=Streptomyces piniterrae TaxID=2571125 RepID=A0A4U0MU90_9ACTN|nr:phenylalanine 4-monooxygenase [Streptomyces piniterrae]TJZ44132.1 phenylalanine 4-monooxygenase [Streptomyces piniterrae]